LPGRQILAGGLVPVAQAFQFSCNACATALDFRTMFHYDAYQLAISSDIPLPELRPAATGGDVEVRLMPQGGACESRSIVWQHQPAECVFSFPRVGRFLVEAGRRVTIVPESGTDASLLSLYVEGMMLAAILNQRGNLVLHASLIAAEGRAIGFLGPVGAGKSTLAAAFHARGYPVVADDNAAIDLTAITPMVAPAFPSLKMYPAVAECLGYKVSGLRPMHDSQIKQAQPVTDGFGSAAIPLERLYVLDPEAGGIEELSPIQSVTELIRHSVPTRWNVRGDNNHLKMCAKLASNVPVFRARTFSQLTEIPEIAGRIERQFLESMVHSSCGN
jgi:hypothetical protein